MSLSEFKITYYRQFVLLYCVMYYSTAAYADISGIASNILENVESSIKIIETDLYNLKDKFRKRQQETVTVDIYYECMCPGCRQFDTQQLVPVVQKLNSYLNIRPYPYGNAQTFEHNGTYEFTCQHGPEECYGNKLHACAIDILRNVTNAVYFNTCMMESSQDGRGSDDRAADVCGKSMGIDSDPIKECAKGNKGTQLLKYYGDQSKKVNFHYVPYILINGELSNGLDFMKDVCAAFIKTPQPCMIPTFNKL